MNPSVRSRLWGSGASFAFGFALANYGILMVAKPDQWLWVGAAAVFMITGALGVLFADTSSRFSVWAVLGFELLILFTLIPFAWMVSLALTPTGVLPHTIWPNDATTANIRAVWHSTDFRHGVVNSLIVAGSSTLIAVLLAAFAAYAIVRLKFRGTRIAYAVVIAALFVPMVALVGPMAGQAFAFGLYDTKRALIVCYLALTLPLALWLFVSLFQRVPWTLPAAARADGATRLQLLRRVYLPIVGPGFLAVVGIVFLVACNDLVLGVALGSSRSSLPVPATLATFGAGFDNPTSATAAAGLLWFLPALLFVLVFQRRIVRLLGRPNR
jgi:ABC-type glycerol-3-phosphate transport system permease component